LVRPMKLKLLIVLIVASTLHALGAERPRSFQTFRLDALKPDPHSCDVKWRADVNQMIWSDDDHVFVWLIFFCDSPNTKDRKNPTELAVSTRPAMLGRSGTTSPSDFFRVPQIR
jgi:hypothetical protein